MRLATLDVAQLAERLAESCRRSAEACERIRAWLDQQQRDADTRHAAFMANRQLDLRHPQHRR